MKKLNRRVYCPKTLIVLMEKVKNCTNLGNAAPDLVRQIPLLMVELMEMVISMVKGLLPLERKKLAV